MRIISNSYIPILTFVTVFCLLLLFSIAFYPKLRPKVGFSLAARQQNPLREVQNIGLPDFRMLHDRVDTAVIDARASDDYKAGHIKNAYNITTREDLQNWLTEKQDKHYKNIVFYCADASCPKAYALARTIDYTNYDIVPIVYKNGYSEWVSIGLPVEN